MKSHMSEIHEKINSENFQNFSKCDKNKCESCGESFSKSEEFFYIPNRDYLVLGWNEAALTKSHMREKHQPSH